MYTYFARRLFSNDTPVDWESMGGHDNIRELIAKTIPGFSLLLSGEEFHIPGPSSIRTESR